MQKSNRFYNIKGGKVYVKPWCECRLIYNRDYCYDCVTSNEYYEQDPKPNPRTLFPVWWEKWEKTNVLTTKDLDFLLGRKFIPKKRTKWPRA